MQLVPQAAIGDDDTFDALAFCQEGVAAPEMVVGRRQVLQAFEGAGVVVISDEGFDALFKFAEQIDVLEKDAVFHRLMPTLDLALGLRVPWHAATVLYVALLKPLSEIAADVTGSVVEQ